MSYGKKQWRDWVLDEDASQPLFRRALEMGVNFFDTADVYSDGMSEEILGRALKTLAVPREHVVVSTKVCNPTGDDINQRGLSRKHVRHAIDHSLRRLNTDYVDLYQIHRFDTQTSVEETLEALKDVIRAGKAIYIGASGVAAWQFAQLLYTADRMKCSRFVSMQNHYNLVSREDEAEMIPLCRSEGVGLIPFGPMARGFLANSDVSRRATRPQQNEYLLESDFAVRDRVTDIARRRGVSNAQVATAWVLQQPGITSSIVGASKIEHLDDAVAALDLSLSSDESRSLTEPYKPHPMRNRS